LQIWHTLIMFPLIFLIISILLFKQSNNYIIYTGYIILFFIYSYQLHKEFMNNLSKPKTITINYLMSHEKKDEPIYIYNNEDALVMHFYYKQVNKFRAIPFDIDFRGSYDLNAWRLKSTTNFNQIFLLNERKPGILWVVNDTVYPGFKGQKDDLFYLENFLNKNCCTLSDTFINNFHIRKLEWTTNSSDK
jgi:hypothetical protein